MNAPSFGPSAELAALSTDLMHNTAFSGRAWVCVGFPTFGAPCSAPNPLTTDKGTLLLSQPYGKVSPGRPPSYGDTLRGGIFSALVGEQTSWSQSIGSGSAPIIHNGLLVSDVTIGGQPFSGALVYLSFAADPRTVLPFSDSTSYGYINQTGKAKVTVIAGSRTITANIGSGQIYVYYDIQNSSVGFGSNAGGRGYPLSLTATEPPDSIYGFENSTLGAVADITRTPGDVVNYTALTQTLMTDLTNPTTLSGNASSGGSLDPTTAICSNLVPIPLSTDHGSFYLIEPYTEDSSTTGTQPYSDNFGVFWSQKGSRTDE